MAANPQCRPQTGATSDNNVRPTKHVIGATVRGPILFITRPTNPVQPMITCMNDATAKAPLAF